MLNSWVVELQALWAHLLIELDALTYLAIACVLMLLRITYQWVVICSYLILQMSLHLPDLRLILIFLTIAVNILEVGRAVDANLNLGVLHPDRLEALVSTDRWLALRLLFQASGHAEAVLELGMHSLPLRLEVVDVDLLYILLIDIKMLVVLEHFCSLHIILEIWIWWGSWEISHTTLV